jgi:hypothetical protein
MPEMAIDGFVFDFIIGDRGLQMTIPVDHSVSLEDQVVAEHAEEGPSHRTGTDRVHGEALAIPVTGATHCDLLGNDAFLVLVLPLPDALDKALSAEVMAGFALQLEESLFDDCLRGDPCVVCSGHPQGVVSLHAVPAGEQVLHDIIHGMAHMKGTGDIGQGHHDDVAVVPLVRDGPESVLLGPASSDRRFDFAWFVLCRQFLDHG